MTTRTLQIMRQNPLKSALTMIGSVAAVVIFLWVVDDRYVNAADFKQFQHQQEQLFVDSRIQQIQDQLFVLDLKVENGSATEIDRAQRARLQRQLGELRR